MTPDDLERLSTAFRPSWELDEAPFAGPASLSPADIRALGGGGTHVDVRSAAFAPAHTSHAPARPVVAEELANKVIVDPGLVAPASVRPPPPPVSERPAVLQSAGPWPAAQVAPPGASARLAAPVAAPATARAAVRSSSMPPLRPAMATDPGFGSGLKKNNTKLFAGIGGAVVLVGAIVWLASGGSDKDKPAPAAPEMVILKPQPNIPPPPPETAAAAAPVAPVAPSKPVVAAQPAAAPAPPPPPVIAATALPQAPPVVAQHAAPAPAPAPHPVAAAPAPAPAPKPATASRPKGPSIVRDVPF